MSETLCTLRTKGGGGGRYTETSLWTNPSPTSNFAAQTVSLSESIDNFKYIKIKFKNTASGSATSSAIFLVNDVKTALDSSGGFNMALSYNPSYSFARKVNYASNTSLSFSSAQRLKYNAEDNSNAIPLEILGLNELAHGTKYTTNASEIAFKSVSANTIPTFTTVAEAKAIWLTINYASAYRALQITNVNPTTGEINNDSLYKIDTNSLGNIEPLTGNKFIVTSNSVTMQNAPSTAATQQSLIYTY